ncbi:hypothetical protein [Janthinobacterium agaricidamnosum]|uniref:hypothetical protein n=1 Tax=Janthinobacterium agaricidamnosum TaxID=55508 RepID=UPI00056F7327|nr:hypothetical protein [Janthinobacterium agaricidamnosum]
MTPINRSDVPEPDILRHEAPKLLDKLRIHFTSSHQRSSQSKPPFDYGRLGEIVPFNQSPYGKATIQTCGLDRPSLRQARFKLANTTHERIDELSNDITERELLWVLDAIFRDGADNQWYCGMVRTIYEQRTGQTWEELEALIKLLRLKPDLSARLCEC